MGKKYLLVLSMLAALIILGVSVSGQAAVTNGDARYNLEGYSRERGKWTRGELKGWLEDNWVPYRLSMASVVPGNFEITIQHDYEWTGSGGPDPGVDVCKSEPGYPLYGEPLFWDEPTSTNFWVGYENGTPLPIIVTTVRIGDFIKPNTIVIQYKSNFSVPSTYGGQNLYLYWMAHLAIGSSGWSGASLHAHTTATGNQDVPIAIPPSNVIYGYKFYDYDANGIWDNGDYGIENWIIYLEGWYLGQLITREVKTNANGRYEFKALPDGTWTITEEVRTGWIPTTSSTYTVTVRRGQVKGPYNFGNVQLEPDINVTKVGDVEKVHVGDTITYTITVENAGNCPLFNVLVVDDNGTPSDISDDVTLYSNGLTKGQVETFIRQRVVTASDTDPLVNVVTAEGYDQLGRKVTDSDYWSVDILKPSIDVIKTANATKIHGCDWVKYNVTVVNTGDCSLDVVLTDPMLGISWTGTLAPGKKHEEIVVYHPENDPTQNTASAVGTDELGKTVHDSDSWCIDILKPGIHIVKTAIPGTINCGDWVTYEYNVTNIGDCILYNVAVTDNKLGLIGTIPTLDVGVTTTLTKSTRLFADTTNVGKANGTDELGKEVSDWDDACVHVIIPPEHPPCFAFECPCPCGCIDWIRVGEIRTLTFIVTNVGDPESRVYYLTLTAVIKDYSILQFVGPYTAYIKIYYSNGTFWSAYINGSLTCEKFAGFSPAGDYWMVTWRVPTTYPDGPYLEGNDGGTLLARLEISFKVKGKAGGTTSLQVFPRATEDHYIDGVHLADIVDKANIWGNDLWYPVHNSYDPYDEAIGIGHSWEAGWEPLPTTDQYAQATIPIFVWSLLPLTTTTTTATTGKTETKEY